ncbi:plexin domain-containing protein 2 isoform X1 [Leptopilina heterotoma]|uniref:plexin domain-containing protein 2 isoform X1 n=2 Tax=Leptopilina heterotoma TaxID=63436 RepID=UPI001CA7E8C0|nr:plexin domain-containing protein 2 isoform X1 [Leptopilina heterotoma]
MACDQWWFIHGSVTLRQMLLLQIIFAFGLYTTVVEADLAYYKNDISRTHSFLDDRIEFSSFEENLQERYRRSVLEPAPKGTAKPQHELSEVQDMQQQQQPKLQTTTAPQQSVVNINTNTSANVSYSTETVTTESPVPSKKALYRSRSDVHMMKNNYTTATTLPVETSTTHLSKPVVWANQTRWTNITHDVKLTNENSETEIGDIPDTLSEVSNSTLLQNNITKTFNDTHQYYNSTFMVDKAAWDKYWVNMAVHPNLQVNEVLSESHRKAATIKLQFDFPFYGHKVRNITIATGGFLYTGEYVHSWLAATQYIAPLMANFDLQLSNRSFVKYADNSTSFTVEWENVVLHDKPEDGAFTFQVTLHLNGDIVFVYTAIPLVVENIEDFNHPVKVGLSDAYIMDRTVFFNRKKTIYEYHRVHFNRQDIKNFTVIYLTALPTCLQMENCKDCLTKVPEFNCKWCPELQQCSTGVSRSKQDWLLKGCDKKSIKELAGCSAKTTSYKDHIDTQGHDEHIAREEVLSASVKPSQHSSPAAGSLEHARENMNMSVSGIIGILVIISLVAGLAGWAVYAYRNPHSASGQILIRYRPSQWSWRRGEARYTVATIHM